jgi:hypothetical protein
VRLLTYSISAFTGLLAAVVFAAALSKWNSPATTNAGQPTATKSETKPAEVTKPPSLPPRPWETQPPPPPLKYKDLDAAGLARLLGGSEVVSVLDAADRVTSVLLKLPQLQAVPPSRIPATSAAVAVDMATAQRVRTLLFDPGRNRQVDAVPGCPPQYGWKLSYFGNGRRVDLFFCFGCGHAAVDLDGVTVGRCLMGGVAKELEKVMKSIEHGEAIFSPPEEAGAPIIPRPPAPAVP